MKVDGTRVLLTGATGGIGHAIARAFAERGASLVLTGRRTDVLEPLAAETGGRAVVADLADRATIDTLLAEAGDVDILVANAALPASGVLTDYTVEQIDRALDVNLRAPILLAKALSAQMAERARGHLVFISSLAGKVSTEGSSLYSATKFGLRGFSQGLREDLHGSGVSASTVFPGFIRDAGMFAEAGTQLPKGVGTKTPEEVAAAVIRVIEKDKAEQDVAPVGLRLGSAFGGLAPQKAAAVTRRVGSRDLIAAHTATQRSKR